MTSASIVVGRMSQHESHSTCDEIGTHQARDLDADDKSRDWTHSRHTVHSHRVKFKSKSRPVRPSLPHASTTADLRSTFDGFRMWLSVVYVYTNTCTCKLDFTFRVSDRAHRQSKCGVMPRPRVPVMFWFRFHALHNRIDEQNLTECYLARALELGATSQPCSHSVNKTQDRSRKSSLICCIAMLYSSTHPIQHSLQQKAKRLLYRAYYNRQALRHGPVSIQHLYSIYTASIQHCRVLYSYTALQQLYSIHPLHHPSARSTALNHALKHGL